MTKHRKEPMKIMQNDQYIREVQNWGDCMKGRARWKFQVLEMPVRVQADRGFAVGNPGDYLMQDPRGVFYVCPRGRFSKLYKVNDGEAGG